MAERWPFDPCQHNVPHWEVCEDCITARVRRETVEQIERELLNHAAKLQPPRSSYVEGVADGLALHAVRDVRRVVAREAGNG